MMQRVAKTLTIHIPSLSKEVCCRYRSRRCVLNVKAVATHQAFFETSASGAADEFRDMTRLYLQSRFGSSMSGKKGIPS
jgi:predicted MarR family transcription regulator